MTTTTIQIDADLEFSASAARPTTATFSTERFNQYGVRANYSDDGADVTSIDVLFRAMEPGLRKNIRVTQTFLAGVASAFSSPVPMQMDHSMSQRANVGTVTAAYASDGLWLIGNVPNTGSQVRSDVIADFMHEPPAITDGSVGFGNDYVIEYDDASDEYVFTDARIAEFSLTPFPAGYDDGGLSASFCAAAAEAGIYRVDDAPDGAENLSARTSKMRCSHARIREF